MSRSHHTLRFSIMLIACGRRRLEMLNPRLSKWIAPFVGQLLFEFESAYI